MSEREDMHALVARVASVACAAARRSPERHGPHTLLTPPVTAADVQRLRERHGLPGLALDERMRIRGVPDRVIEVVCAGQVRETDASRLAFELAERGGLLVLASEPGGGKTTAAGWLLLQVAGLYVRAEQLAELDDSGTLDARMRTTGLLVVDDVGKEHSPSGYAISRLDAVVTFRWDHCRSTLLATNLDAATFRTRYGARIADRANAAANPMGWRDLGGSSLRRSSL